MPPAIPSVLLHPTPLLPIPSESDREACATAAAFSGAEAFGVPGNAGTNTSVPTTIAGCAEAPPDPAADSVTTTATATAAAGTLFECDSVQVPV